MHMTAEPFTVPKMKGTFDVVLNEVKDAFRHSKACCPASYIGY